MFDNRNYTCTYAFILTKQEVKNVAYWPSSFFAYYGLREQDEYAAIYHTCTYFSYILISGGMPSMAHWGIWLSPSPQLFSFFLLIVVLTCFISLFACNVVE